jgi:hypothetical protein
MGDRDDDMSERAETQKVRLNAQYSAISALSAQLVDGMLDDDGLAATMNQIRQLDTDHQQVLDTLHVPEDAGPHRDALVSILMRIPEGWGRWISCDAGWYPLISRLHADLQAVDPEYVVHQVKEKFGTLRFYAHTDRGDVREQIEALVAAAEQQSTEACELCSAPAELCVIVRGQGRWYKTLCPACIDAHAAEDGPRYAPLPPRPHKP